MTQLQKATLQDVCTLVTDGTHDTPKTLDSGIPFIKAKQINDGIIEFADCEFISYEDHLKVISRSKPEKGDTLFAHIGASLGEAAYINTDIEFSIKNVALFKPDQKKIIPRYLFYLVINNEFQDGIKNRRTGSAQPFVSLDILRTNPIRFIEDIPTQHRIADILSAYDDLIENNKRRIRILEQMTQAIYQEWFGKVDKESLPKGWEVMAYTDIIDVMSGGTPRTSVPEYWDGNIPWFTPQDLSDSFYVLDTTRKITELGLSKCNSKLYPENTVYITARGTVGKIVLAAVPMAMSQTNYALIGKNGISQFWVYLLTKELVDVFKKKATGAVFDTIVVDTFRQQKIIKPKANIIEKFHQEVEPIFKLLKNLQTKNVNLRQTRDLLLPRLIIGDIEVSDLNNN